MKKQCHNVIAEAISVIGEIELERERDEEQLLYSSSQFRHYAVSKKMEMLLISRVLQDCGYDMSGLDVLDVYTELIHDELRGHGLQQIDELLLQFMVEVYRRLGWKVEERSLTFIDVEELRTDSFKKQELIRRFSLDGAVLEEWMDMCDQDNIFDGNIVCLTMPEDLRQRLYVKSDERVSEHLVQKVLNATCIFYSFFDSVIQTVSDANGNPIGSVALFYSSGDMYYNSMSGFDIDLCCLLSAVLLETA